MEKWGNVSKVSDYLQTSFQDAITLHLLNKKMRMR